jgi:hypothetical protein
MMLCGVLLIRIGHDFGAENTDVVFRDENLKGKEKGIDGKRI